jgi:hypothetical protein
MPDPRPWTVLVYIVADDDRQPPNGSLNTIAQKQIAELSKTAREMKGDPLVLAQVDFTNAPPNRFNFLEEEVDPATACTPGYKTSASSSTSHGTTLREVNSASRRTLSGFFEYAAGILEERQIENSRYALMFWGHAAGPEGLFRDPQPSTENPSLKLPDLRLALKDALKTLNARYVDLVMFQDCWISTLEVAYELKDTVRYIVASQEIIPIAAIWPYGLVFRELIKPASPDLEMVSNIAGHLSDQYKKRIAFTGLTLDAAPSLAWPLRNLSAALQSLTEEEAILSRDIMRHSLGGDRALIDVRTFCKGLRGAGIATQEALDLERVANTLIVRNTADAEKATQRGLTGVSVFRRPPEAEVNKSLFADFVSLFEYNELALCKDTLAKGAGWSDVAFADRFETV